MKLLPVLVLAQFAALYPLFLWIAPLRQLPAGFTRFNLGMATVILGLATLLAAAAGLPWPMLRLLLLLAATTLVLQRLLWENPLRARSLLTPIQLVWGLTLWQPILATTSMTSPLTVWISIALGGLAFGGVMYAMVLGHWYLNVVDLPVRFLQMACRAALGILVVRLVWSLGILAFSEAVVQQRMKPAYVLLGELDGIFLWLGLAPGLIGGMVVTFMALKSALIQSTQSATGLLYVALVLVAMSTLSFSGYLVLKDMPL